ncbi:MAG: hypothetical protein K1X94_21220 [Sandaracinaceae bacterium]|nr:hypothetical protein [Sandaracinaceae bacterium]
MSVPVVRVVRGREDASLRPVVVSRRPLFFTAGADEGLDRSAHVRAASGLAWATVKGTPALVLAQDDTSHLALVDPWPSVPEVRAIALDHEVSGRRVFEARLGNKKHKLDLEACVPVTFDGAEHLLVVGSGSLPVRERFVLVDPEGHARILPAPALYATLRDDTRFSGSELNLEGAACMGAQLLLFQRGNGAARGEIPPVDAVARLSATALLQHLLAGGPTPVLEAITRYVLGEIGGVRLTFTDATALDDRVAFLAGAEASPDAIEDGVVAGVAFGVMSRYGDEVRWARLREHDGPPYLGKAEGLAPRTPGVDDGRFWAVVDRDDPDAPAELLELAT